MTTNRAPYEKAQLTPDEVDSLLDGYIIKIADGPFKSLSYCRGTFFVRDKDKEQTQKFIFTDLALKAYNAL